METAVGPEVRNQNYESEIEDMLRILKTRRDQKYRPMAYPSGPPSELPDLFAGRVGYSRRVQRPHPLTILDGLLRFLGRFRKS